MRKFKDLIEARDDIAAFTLGRFNPPTTGHEKLITKLDSIAKKNSSSMYVFPTHTKDAARNPLPHNLKVAYMKKMYKKYAKNIQISKARNVFEVAKLLYDKGHKSVIMVVGSDRVTEFTKLLDKYMVLNLHMVFMNLKIFKFCLLENVIQMQKTYQECLHLR